MSQLTDAADTIRQHIRVLEALKTAASALDGLDSIDNQTNEANQRRQVAEQRANDAYNNLNAVSDLVTAKTAELDQLKVQGEQTLAAVQDKRDQLVADAKVTVKQMLEQATNDGEQIKVKARMAVAGAQKDQRDAELARDQALESHAAIKVQIDEAQNTLADWNDRIEKAKAAAAAIIAPTAG